jgi:hypothetical protein
MATNCDFRLLAENCFFEFESDVFTQIRATLGAAATTAASSEEVSKTKEVTEDFTEILENGGIEATRTRSANRGMAKTIVCCALISVGKDGVSFAAFLEFLFRVRIIGIAVRMELQRQLAISAFDFLLGGFARNAEHLVVIAFYVTGQDGPLNPFELLTSLWFVVVVLQYKKNKQR